MASKTSKILLSYTQVQSKLEASTNPFIQYYTLFFTLQYNHVGLAISVALSSLGVEDPLQKQLILSKFIFAMIKIGKNISDISAELLDKICKEVKITVLEFNTLRNVILEKAKTITSQILPVANIQYEDVREILKAMSLSDPELAESLKKWETEALIVGDRMDPFLNIISFFIMITQSLDVLISYASPEA